MEIKQVKAIILNQLGVRLIDYGSFYKNEIDEDYGDTFEVYIREKYSFVKKLDCYMASISLSVGDVSLELTQDVVNEQDLYDLINKFKLLTKALKGE